MLGAVSLAITKVAFSVPVLLYFLVNVIRLVLTATVNMMGYSKDRHYFTLHSWLRDAVRECLRAPSHVRTMLQTAQRPLGQLKQVRQRWPPRLATSRLLIGLVQAVQETMMFLMLWPGPLLILLLLFTINFYLYASLCIGRLVGEPLPSLIPRLRRNVAETILTVGGFLHNWQIEGFNNIPTTGGVVLAYHHGPLPVDYMYLVAYIYVKTGRLAVSVVDRSLMLLPGVQTLAQVMHCYAPNREECIEWLRQGRILGVAPGGGKQAMLGTAWGRRRGYAVVAATADCPVVAVYTGNIEEAYSVLSWTKPIFIFIHSMTKVAMAAVYGGLPLTLRTRIGRPIKLVRPRSQMSSDKAIEDQQTHLSRVMSSVTLKAEHPEVTGCGEGDGQEVTITEHVDGRSVAKVRAALMAKWGLYSEMEMAAPKMKRLWVQTDQRPGESSKDGCGSLKQRMVTLEDRSSNLTGSSDNLKDGSNSMKNRQAGCCCRGNNCWIIKLRSFHCCCSRHQDGSCGNKSSTQEDGVPSPWRLGVESSGAKQEGWIQVGHKWTRIRNVTPYYRTESISWSISKASAVSDRTMVSGHGHKISSSFRQSGSGCKGFQNPCHCNNCGQGILEKTQKDSGGTRGREIGHHVAPEMGTSRHGYKKPRAEEGKGRTGKGCKDQEEKENRIDQAQMREHGQGCHPQQSEAVTELGMTEASKRSQKPKTKPSSEVCLEEGRLIKLDAGVRQEMRLLRSDAKSYDSYADCLRAWLLDQNIGRYRRRLVLLLCRLLPALCFLILTLFTARVLRLLLWDLLTVMLYQLLTYSGLLPQLSSI